MLVHGFLQMVEMPDWAEQLWRLPAGPGIRQGPARKWVLQVARFLLTEPILVVMG
jgi:hypothetical protein